MDFKSVAPSSYRDPGTAALISIIPALGQLYNGQTRKGLLFLAVDAINLVLFSVLIFTTPLAEAIANFGLINHLKPNPGLKYALLQLHFGSPVSLALMCCLVAFIGLAMRDAYDNANNLQRRSLYPGHALDLSEATSGSYLLHVSLLAVGFILAFFFLVPPVPLKQVTEIQFFNDQPKVPHKVNSAHKSENNSENAGQRRNREVAPSPPQTHEQVRPPVRNNPPTLTRMPLRPTPVHQMLPPTLPLAPPNRMLPVPREATPAPPPLRQNVHPVSNTPPSPIVRPATTGNANSPPLPTVIAQNQNAPGPMPITSSSARSSNTGTTGPTPMAVATGPSSSTATAPHPVPISGRSGNRSGNPTEAAPVPGRPHFSDSGPKLAIGQAALRPMPAASGNNVPGGPIQSDKPTAQPSVGSEGSTNWGPYMADLQRRIKRAWFPPRLEANRRIVVIFKIHTNGELSNLRLSSPSGSAEADRCALAAIENAAPFRHLPEGAAENADIQFTFDYNVFNGKFHDY